MASTFSEIKKYQIKSRLLRAILPPPPPTFKQAPQSLEWYNVSNINCMLIIVGTKHFASQCRPIGRQKVEAKMFRFHNSLRKSQLDVLAEIYSYIMVAQVSQVMPWSNENRSTELHES